MDSIRQEIAKNLLVQRKRAGLSQKQLAELLGVKNSSVSNWENGRNSIDIETLYKVSLIFYVPVSELYGQYGDILLFSEKEKNLVEAYRKTPDMQSAVDKLLDVNTISDKKEPHEKS